MMIVQTEVQRTPVAVAGEETFQVFVSTSDKGRYTAVANVSGTRQQVLDALSELATAIGEARTKVERRD